MVTVTGREKLKSKFDAIPRQLTNLARRGAKVGGEMLADEMRQRAGNAIVRDNIRVRTKNEGDVMTVIVDIAPKAWPRALARWMEFGTGAHDITIDVRAAGEDTAKALGRDGLPFFGTSVRHPGALAHPFIRPTKDHKLAEAAKATTDYIKAGLAKQAGSGA